MLVNVHLDGKEASPSGGPLLKYLNRRTVL